MATTNTDKAPLLEEDEGNPNPMLVSARASLVHVPPSLIHDASIPLIPQRYFPSFAAHHGMAFGPAAMAHPEAWRVVHPPEGGHGATARVVFVAAAFALIFTAYNVAQTFLTTRFPTYGFYSFATIYTFFAIGSLVAPNVGGVIGLVPCLVLGGVTYVGLIASFLAQNGLILLLVS
jgi:hypothetical protein